MEHDEHHLNLSQCSHDERRLREEHGLVRVHRPVYVLVPLEGLDAIDMPNSGDPIQGAMNDDNADTAKEKKKRESASNRQANRRNRLKAEDMVSLNVPRAIRDEIKNEGGIEPWLAMKLENNVVERIVEVPQQKSEDERKLFSIGVKVSKLTGIRRLVVWKILGLHIPIKHAA